MDFQCQTCPRCFASWVSRNQHMDALDHWAPTYECETCTREFTSQHAANQHMNAVGHWAPKIECDTCTKLFPTQDAANIHMDALGHWEHYCHSCDRKFMGESNLRAVSILVPFIHFFQPLFSLLRFWTDSVQAICLDYWHHFPHKSPFNTSHPDSISIFQHLPPQRITKTYLTNYTPPPPPPSSNQHLNSRIHRGTKLSCPFCTHSFVSPSGVSHHLETGSCSGAPNLNRASVARMIRQIDPHHAITTKQIEWHTSDDEGEFFVTNAAWNGVAWECYMCHREFGSARALTQHVNSPAHEQKIYRCPNRRAECGREFTSLAGLFNHLESESCGLTRFEKVVQAQRSLTDAMMGKRTIGYSDLTFS
ncbi:hypothetical protein POX_f08194 [Penicillium oxalicum]|uniref:hypothetical protein n=1 Tax=Penicillium oxalicum TaxID=69781 RepID=UPI0020B72488|nr:hypothetical protein POX_f08194 [Penicillium oxalicum]KAI2787817.1 hypothetical protein POX_f08194 [Penicillium oxalicum]